MNISHLNFYNITKIASSAKEKSKEAKTEQSNVQQFSRQSSSAALAYGSASIAINKTAPATDKKENTPQQKTINLFYFSDTHGELSGLTKVAAAKESAEQFCGGKDNLTVLGSGDLISGKQEKVIAATVDVVNKMGMEATALGNHERGRSDAKLKQLSEDLAPEILAVNASENDKNNCGIASSKILNQNGQEFIVVGAQPLTKVQSVQDIVEAIDSEVATIKAERTEKGISTDLPVIFLSHMGSDADKYIAENSESVNLILGGHSHHVEDFDFKSKDGRTVKVLQGGKNNSYATVVTMEKKSDGTVVSNAKKIDLKQDVNGICSDLQTFYGNDKSEINQKALDAAQNAEKSTLETLSAQVGEKVDLAYVPEGYGYNLYQDGYEKDRERNYSNPVSNIMADAMLAATADAGVQVSFHNAPSVKDTLIPDNQGLSNYDVMSRMLPFGGEVVTVELPVSKFYEIIEKNAQTVIDEGESQLIQVGGMTYSVNAEKAKSRFEADINILSAEDQIKKAKANGSSEEKIAELEKNLASLKESYHSLPGCVEKIMILNPDGTELKINPKAIARGDFDGKTIKCATNDFLAGEVGIDKEEYGFVNTGKELTKVFEQGIEEVRKNNDGVMFVDQNDVRISINDKNGLVNGYEIPTGINTKYWY